MLKATCMVNNNRLEVNKKMNDFLPKSEDNSAVAVVNNSMSIDMRASLELVQITQNDKFLSLLQLESVLKQLQQFHRIETQAQYSQAIDAFNATKLALKDCEALRHIYVDFPTKVADLINGLFKPIRDGLSNTKDHLGKIIDNKKLADEDVARRAQEAVIGVQPVNIAAPQAGEQFAPVQVSDVIPIPGNVVASERGAKIHTRKSIAVNITDLDAFLKACVSKNERLLWLGAAKSTFITINLPVLKALIEKESKRTVPGVELTEERQTI